MNSETIINTINMKLKDIFEDKFQEFKECLKKSNAIISGSFIIECILNDFSADDIDIFVPVKRVNTVEINAPRHDFEKCCISKFFMGVWFMEKRIINCYDSDIGPCNHITELYDIVVNKRKLQLIGVDYEPDKLTEFILTGFDFDICKNAFYTKNEKECLYVHDFESIITRKIIWKYNGRVRPSFIRAVKYKERGFDVKFPLNMIDVFLYGVKTDNDIKTACTKKTYEPDKYNETKCNISSIDEEINSNELFFHGSYENNEWIMQAIIKKVGIEDSKNDAPFTKCTYYISCIFDFFHIDHIHTPFFHNSETTFNMGKTLQPLKWAVRKIVFSLKWKSSGKISNAFKVWNIMTTVALYLPYRVNYPIY